MNSFSEILDDLIFQSKLSLRKLAEESNVSATQYGKYLKGTFPNIEVAVRIANYFDCSLDFLFGLTEIKNFKGSKNINLSNFVSKYEKILKDNKTTHYKFAKSNGLSESCLRHWKYGQTPKIYSLLCIAKTFDISIDYLVGRTAKKTN